jgi:CBS domain-containing protein
LATKVQNSPRTAGAVAAGANAKGGALKFSEILARALLAAARREVGDGVPTVSDIMTRKVHLVGPDETIAEAARKMAKIDAGSLLVGQHDCLVGMITDRDIVVRGVAAGKSPDTKVQEIMSDEIKYCFEDQTLEELATIMAEQQLRRLAVVDRQSRLVGVVSLADLARGEEADIWGNALRGISQPGGAHCQSGGSGRRSR